MASIWKLPVIFICENNQFATEVPFSNSSGSKNVGNRGFNYGIEGYEIDGNDVFEIHKTIKLALKNAKRIINATTNPNNPVASANANPKSKFGNCF